jgi:ferredoxin
MCWDAAPQFFDLDDEGIVILLRDSVAESDPDLCDGVTAAAKSCPTGTIQLERQ